MNRIQSTPIYQSDDFTLTLHLVQKEDVITHHFEASTPNGIFIDDDFLVSSICMLRSMDSLMNPLGDLNLD
jgi:hypothetical protein